MSKIYLLINGDETHKYVLTNMELVNDLKERFPDEYFSEPEELIIDKLPTRPDGQLFHVIMSKEGTVEDIYAEELIIDYEDHYPINDIRFDINNDLYTWTWAKDDREAISIVNYMRKTLLKTSGWRSRVLKVREEFKVSNE